MQGEHWTVGVQDPVPGQSRFAAEPASSAAPHEATINLVSPFASPEEPAAPLPLPLPEGYSAGSGH
jgi:hypothetical protein